MASVPNDKFYKTVEERALKGVYKERQGLLRTDLTVFSDQKTKIEKRIGTERVKETNAEELARLNRLIPLLESQRQAPSALVSVVESDVEDKSSSASKPSNASSSSSSKPSNASSSSSSKPSNASSSATKLASTSSSNSISASKSTSNSASESASSSGSESASSSGSNSSSETSPKEKNKTAPAAKVESAPANMRSELKSEAVLLPSLVVEEPKPNPCPTLHDPCTREPLSGMPELEKRIRELKRQNDTTPVGLYGLTNATTNYEFVMGPFLDKTIPLDDLVTFRLNAGGQVGSDIYEVLSRMFVFFGGITDVNPQQGGNYQFMEKVEATAPRVFAGPREAFMAMKCKADSTSGVSDITLVRTPGAAGGAPIGRPYCESDCSVAAEGVIQTYIMSVKWYKQDKNAEHYDLEKLKATADTMIPAEGKPYGIIVFLKSKRDFERAHQRASRQYIRHIGKTYFGWEEDVKPFLQDIRRQLFEEAELRGLSPARILEDRYFVAGAKPTLGLQLHQEIITQSVCNTKVFKFEYNNISNENYTVFGVTDA